jgi:hypothetical protein
VASGCAPGGAFSPRDRWLSDDQRQIPYIFSEWTGVTGTEIVYGQDGEAAYQIAVLENVHGPHPTDASDKDIPVRVTTRTSRINHLSNAHQVLLKSTEVPPGLSVRVDGFMRASSASASIYDPETGRNEVAGRTPPPRGRKLDRFDLIKARRIWEIRPDGAEQLIWKTDVPFRGL